MRKLNCNKYSYTSDAHDPTELYNIVIEEKLLNTHKERMVASPKKNESDLVFVQTK